MKQDYPKRTIRSYVLRQGRMTISQSQALKNLWPQYGIELTDRILDFVSLFGNDNPVTIEIGFGMGDTLVAMAAQYPERNFLGIEVHGPGVGALLAGVEKHGLTNLRVIQDDAVKVLQQMVSDHSVACFQIFFPDPWHKKRHHKRRLIQPEFVAMLVTKLTKGGVIHCATDWQDYAEQMMRVLSGNQILHNTCGDGKYVENQQLRPSTKFEKRGERLGHGVWDLLFDGKYSDDKANK
ncbi:MAG: tRNA (guanosine(46)-N7)-methyltransferase TrmB [Coxiellaceae bacterium]|nr:tRNA (guanosine(46)-N7)-methyltransferase TrmB [Coxiellaceae bacterium]